MKHESILFGGLSGKIGNVVFVQRGKTTFIRSVPSKRKSGYSKKELVIQSKFGVTSRIAGQMCLVEELKHFWKQDKSRNRTSFNQMFRGNINHFDIEKFSGYINLIPDFGFNLREELTLSIGKSGIEIESAPLNCSYSFDKVKAKYIIAAGVIILKKKSSAVKCKYDVMAFRSDKILFDPDSSIKLKIVFSGERLKNWSSYPLKKVFGTFITLSDQEAPIRYSNCFTNTQ
jgi:hypothetical protein